MPWPVHPTGFFGARGDNDTYRIERSLRFNSADSAYLNRTFSTGNRKTWTWSGWIKRTTLGTTQRFFTVRSGNDDTTTGEIAFETTNQLIVIGWNTVWKRTSQVFRDVSGWYHFVVVMDTTQATANNRVRVYVNGSEVTSFETTNNPTQNADLAINQNLVHYIGTASYGDYSNFYLTEVNFIDGQALTPSSFGETDAITGRWKAKAYSGTYGTNGFYLKFADNSGTTSTTLGKDSSPNGNNWTPNNFSVTAGAGNDSLVDSPTNYGSDAGVGGEVRGNYATWNPLRPSGYVFSNGNLDVVGSGANNQNYPLSNFTAPSGKWYFECTSASMGTDPFVGISDIAKKYSIIYGKAGTISKGDVITYTTLSTKSSFTGGDIIGIAVNADNSTVAFYKNNVLQDTINFSSALMVNTDWYAICYSSSNPTTTWTINFGQRPFAYTAPTGFKALCTTNLPTPIIKKPSTAMDVVTYTGNGSARSITGFEFSPDLVWIKSRSVTGSHVLSDSVRGANKQLFSNLTNAEQSVNDKITSFNSNGFSLGIDSVGTGSVNVNSATYVAWSWDEAPIAGMDIVSYSGNSSTQNVSHGLGVAPSMIIVKTYSPSVDAGEGNWCVYHRSLGANRFVYLDLTNAAVTSTTIWNNTAPTASVFSLGNDNNVNKTGKTQIAYCFSEVEGFSRFGSYTGNLSSDGPFIWCGFRPRYVMVKGDSVSNWNVFDAVRGNVNPNQTILRSNLINAEIDGVSATAGVIDFLSNGFKMRGSYGDTNANSTTFIFAAFAESPFKYARAR